MSLDQDKVFQGLSWLPLLSKSTSPVIHRSTVRFTIIFIALILMLYQYFEALKEVTIWGGKFFWEEIFF